MSTGYAALLVGLVLYTVEPHRGDRAREHPVGRTRGQIEASSAIGLSDGQRLRFVVLPQAFRVAVPPIINQFLNLTKNTSLGIAVGFAEVALITRRSSGTATRRCRSSSCSWPSTWRSRSRSRSSSNVVNRRLQLVER